MPLKRTPIALLLPVLLLAGQAATAAIPQTVAFQGFLSDDDGAPLDGTVSLQLSLYDVASGGTARWTETQAPVAVSDGVLSVALGESTPFPAGLFESGPRFLGVAVNGEAELPRTQLLATPFALRAEAADTTTAALQIRSGTELKLATSASSDGSDLTGHIGDGTLAWSLIARDTGARSVLNLLTSNDGFARLGQVDSSLPAVLQLVAPDGISELTPESLHIGTPSRFFEIDLAEAGDASVRLPGNAITRGELGDEPGLASRINTGLTSLTSTVSSVLSRSITPPADGYVLALAQCVARIFHTQGTGTSGAAGLSEDGVNFGSAQDVNIQITSNAAGGSYSTPLHVNAVFGVTGGVAKTIHLVGSETSGVIDLEDVSLTLLFVPTAYGTVSETLAAADDGEQGGARGPQSAAEIDAEKSESRRANEDRLAGEFAAMAARQAELEQKVAALEVQQVR